MCLCAGAVFVEKRYWPGLAPAHWRLKLQVSIEQTALTIVHSHGTQWMGNISAT